MGRYTIPIRTVTPLFLAGADQFGEPELRAPSVRGALRYWLRAGLGGVLGDRKLDELRKAEREVFGSAGGDMEGSASPIVIRVTSDQVSNHRPAWKPVRKGRDYLYWSMSPQRRCYFAPPYGWSLDLSVRPGAGAADQAVVQTLAALWLLVQLGGLGARSRRTAGSLAADEPPEELPASLRGLRFALQAKAASELSTELREGLGIVRRMFQRGRSATRPESPAAFDILHPAVCRIWVLSADHSGAPWGKWEEAADAIGQSLRGFRHNHEPEHTAVRQWLAGGGSIQAVERAAFGLPLPFHYKQGSSFQRGPTAVVKPQPQGYERRASPLWLKVAQTGNGSCYFGIATLFKSELLPGDMQLTATAGQDVAPTFAAPSAGYALIEQFIQKQFAATEVHYG